MTDEFAQLDRSPPSRQEALASISAQVRAQAQAPTLTPEGRLTLPAHAGALQAWLDPDRLIEAISRAIPLPDGLSQEANDEQRTFLESRLLELERQEEALVCAARQEGIMTPRRPDADPRAILGVTRSYQNHQEEEQAREHPRVRLSFAA